MGCKSTKQRSPEHVSSAPQPQRHPQANAAVSPSLNSVAHSVQSARGSSSSHPRELAQSFANLSSDIQLDASISQLRIYADVLLEVGLIESPRALNWSYKEQLEHGAGFTEAQVAHLRTLFDSIDTDGVGVIGRNEYVAFYQQQPDCALSEEETISTLVELDADSYGTLTFDEFVRACKATSLREEAKVNPSLRPTYDSYIATNRKIISVVRSISPSSLGRLQPIHFCAAEASIQLPPAITSQEHRSGGDSSSEPNADNPKLVRRETAPYCE